MCARLPSLFCLCFFRASGTCGMPCQTSCARKCSSSSETLRANTRPLCNASTPSLRLIKSPSRKVGVAEKQAYALRLQAWLLSWRFVFVWGLERSEQLFEHIALTLPSQLLRSSLFPFFSFHALDCFLACVCLLCMHALVNRATDGVCGLCVARGDAARDSSGTHCPPCCAVPCKQHRRCRPRARAQG